MSDTVTAPRPCRRCGTPLELTNPGCPPGCGRWRCAACAEERWASDFNVRANEIVRALNAALALVNDFLNDHREGCDCLACRDDPEDSDRCHAATVRFDLRGLSWALTVGASCIDCMVLQVSPGDLEELRRSRASCGATADDPVVAGAR